MKSILKTNKKGMSLNDIYPAVLTIVLVGIILGIGIYVLAELRTNVATTYTGTDVLTNSTSTGPMNYSTLTDASKDDYTLTSIASIVSSTGTYTLPVANYTWNASGEVIWSPTTVGTYAVDKFFNISSTYTYDAANSPEESINTTVDALADFAGWLAVIVVVIAAAIVLGIVLSSFGRRTPGV